MSEHHKPGSPFLILLISLVIVGLVSIIPLAGLTNGKLSDFSLFSDLFGLNDSNPNQGDSSMPVDPMLLELMAKAQDEDEEEIVITTVVETEDGKVDTVIRKPAEIPAAKAATRDLRGIVDIEDYTENNTGLSHLKDAIESGRFARIAFLGDSYIEGDIFVQNVRSLLQSRYGGSGVGYVNMYSEFPGFRQSVNQSGSGWTAHIAGKKGTDGKYIGIAESYFTPDGNATAKYKGAKKIPHTDSWTVSKFLCIAPSGSTVYVSSDGKNEAATLPSSPDVQCLELDGYTTQFDVSTSDNSLIALGVWLDSATGIGVDCMSTRGFSGVSLTEVDKEISHKMARFIDYDLIVIQFGLNALSVGQNNYSFYSKQISKVVNHLRLCYPNADFLIMGVGDRGEKKNGEIHSMSTISAMISAQRDAARTARCLFWNTREAMGGEDAIVDWTRQGLTNKDYIHMTHKGGSVLAESFYQSLIRLLQ